MYQKIGEVKDIVRSCGGWKDIGSDEVIIETQWDGEKNV